MTESIHELVRRSVAERQPIDDAERFGVERFLLEFDRLADPFDQRLDRVHVTGSAIVVGPRGVVLLRHKRLGMWLQPGGHIDPGETPWGAARRETLEETGLEASFAHVDASGVPHLLHVDVHAGGRGHTHLDLRYQLDGGSTDPSPADGESPDVAWFGWPAAIERAGDERLVALLRSLATRF